MKINQFLDINFKGENHQTIKQIIRFYGGWTKFQSSNGRLTPSYLTKTAWYELWKSEVKDRPLLYYYRKRFETVRGFSPTFSNMSWIITDELKEEVVMHIRSKL